MKEKRNDETRRLGDRCGRRRRYVLTVDRRVGGSWRWRAFRRWRGAFRWWRCRTLRWRRGSFQWSASRRKRRRLERQSIRLPRIRLPPVRIRRSRLRMGRLGRLPDLCELLRLDTARLRERMRVQLQLLLVRAASDGPIRSAPLARGRFANVHRLRAQIDLANEPTDAPVEIDPSLELADDSLNNPRAESPLR